ncbi:MAG TPA: hypothetical protein VD813_10875, partial [Pseudonocardia sp.]|nr:hypothetical protein [Pseudonocardia sp.]
MTCPVAVRMAAFPWRAPRDGAGAVPGATTARGVTVRPLGRAEAPAAVDAVFAGLSPRSRFLRFHSPVPRLAPGVRERLTDLDGHARVALVAETGGVAVG